MKKLLLFLFLSVLLPQLGECTSPFTSTICCEAPDTDDIDISGLHHETARVCVEPREDCSNERIRIKFREVGTSAWTYTSSNAGQFYCGDIGCKSCIDYELQVAYYNDECGLTPFSNSVPFIIPGKDCVSDCCIPDIHYTIRPTDGCREVDICLDDGYGDCEVSNFEVTYKNEEGEQVNMNTTDAETCITVTMPARNRVFNYNLELMIDGCEESSVLQNQSYKITPDDCAEDCCLIKPRVSYNQLSCSSIQVSINDYIGMACQARYMFRYKRSNSGNWTNSNFLTNNSFTINSLDPNETYDIQVYIKVIGCGFQIAKIYDVSFNGCNPNLGDDGSNAKQITTDNRHISNALATDLEFKKTELNRITTYPNPFTNSLSIDVVTTQTNSYQLSLFDVHGKILKTQDGQVEKGFNTIKIDDLKEYSAGIYFYQFLLGDQVETGIVNKH